MRVEYTAARWVVPVLGLGAVLWITSGPQRSPALGTPAGPETQVPVGASSTLAADGLRNESLAAMVENLSEEGAYFDTDNLISNERSFVRVVEALEPVGGVYVGVGPEQNFTFIARTRPKWAFLVDIRRDNLVQHLFLNAVLSVSPSPEAYLRTLLSLPDADPPASAAEVDLDEVIDRIDGASASRDLFESNVLAHEAHVQKLGLVLDDSDRKHLREVAEQFFEQQLDLRFRSHGRGLSSRYPTYRDLIAARTASGGYASFLGSAEDYTFVRELALAGRLVPVVGDFAGSRALRSIGEFARNHGLEITAFYTSNVEFYLLRNGVFDAYAGNLAVLPWATDGLFIRACFDYGGNHPLRLPGHRSATVLQHYREFARLDQAGRLRDSWDLCTLGLLEDAARR